MGNRLDILVSFVEKARLRRVHHLEEVTSQSGSNFGKDDVVHNLDIISTFSCNYSISSYVSFFYFELMSISHSQ